MQRYDVILEGQLGQRLGTLEWEETDGEVKGFLILFGSKNPVCGRRDGSKFLLTHKLHTAVSILDCETQLEIQEDEISGVVMSQGSSMKIHGRKSQPEQGADE